MIPEEEPFLFTASSTLKAKLQYSILKMISAYSILLLLLILISIDSYHIHHTHHQNKYHINKKYTLSSLTSSSTQQRKNNLFIMKSVMDHEVDYVRNINIYVNNSN